MTTKVEAKIITPERVEELLAAKTDSLLIDVLPAARFAQVHIPGAVNACVYEVVFLDSIGHLAADRERPLIVYGASDRTHDAGTAAAKLLRAGYRDVAILAGGLEAWRRAGKSVAGTGEAEAAPVTLPDGNFRIDTDASRIEWTGRNANSTHVGTLKLSEGEVEVRNGEIQGRFVIDMTSIENLNLAGDELQPVLEAHLKSDDFFFVKLFPTASFALSATPTTTIAPVSAPNYAVKGELSLRGVKAEQAFEATIVATDDGRLSAEAHFDFDRTRWGVIYGSCRFFEHLGMHLVYDLISLQLRILTRPE